MSTAKLAKYLSDCDRKYDSEMAMLADTWTGPGYHSQTPLGTRVHPVRDSLDYALGLLQAGGENCSHRAVAVLRKILALQDKNVFSPTYGVWPWLLEEPIAQMDPPDWNWADFCGARLSQILAEHSSVLPADLRGLVRDALGHAAWCIFRRNVRLEYTNIAIMGGGVTAAAGELLGEPRLLSFGRERLQRIVRLSQYHGSFTEYNSPTYTMVALKECERVLHVVHDAATREAAEQLRQTAWSVIAEHFHPGTQQWAGPHARAYGNYLFPGTVVYLSAQTGAPMAPHPKIAGMDAGASLVPSLPCPSQWRQRFWRLPESVVDIRRRFVRREDPSRKPASPFSSDTLVNFYRHQQRSLRYRYGDRVGVTWMNRDAVLGSVNHENLWNQRRALIGYWRTEVDPAVCLRLRFLHDGHDFASALVRNQQQGPRVLSAVTMVTDLGDLHMIFDHPQDDVFRASDFRLRYELTGRGVHVEQLSDNRFALAAGAHCAIIHTLPGIFNGRQVKWEHGQEDGQAFVDAVCYCGAEHGFNLETIGPVRLAAAVELLDRGSPSADAPVRLGGSNSGEDELQWAGMSMRMPVTADAYPS